MGIIHSIYFLGTHQNRQTFQIFRKNQKELKKLTPIEIWKMSEKLPMNLINLLNNTSQDVWYDQVIFFLKNVKYRQRYQSYLEIIIQKLRQKNQNQSQQKKQLYVEFYNKMKNSFFISDQFSQKQIESVKNSTRNKLIYLYSKFRLKNNANFIQKAMIYNYPQIFDNIQQFGEYIVEEFIFIDNQISFLPFIISAQKLQRCIHKIQSQLKYIDRQLHEQILNKIKKTVNGYQIYLPMIRYLLQNNQSYTSELVLKGLVNGRHILKKQQQMVYLYVKCYNIFVYELGFINFKYQQFQQLDVLQIIHKYLTYQQPQQIAKLKNCFKISIISDPVYFEQCLQKYIFSDKCLMTVCLSILSECQLINYSDDFIQKYLKKIFSCNYEIARNRSKVVYAAEIIIKMDAKHLKNLEQIFNIAEIYLIFNISYKINTISNFIYQVYSVLECQQQAMILLKSLISKYYISDLNRSIRLPKTNQLLNLSNVESIVKLCIYLKQNLSKNNIVSTSQLHQMIFKHMLMFYRYEQVRQLLSEEMINKYGIVYESIEQIIIENIIELMNKQRISQIKKDIDIQLQLISNHNLQKIKVKSMHRILRDLEKLDIQFSTKERTGGILGKIQLLYWLIQKYRQKLTVLDYTMLYENICFINGSHTDDYLLNDQFLKFRVFLAKELYKEGYLSYGEDIILQLRKYDPPWLSEELVHIIQDFNTNNLPYNLLRWAFEHCIKGEDMQYLLNVKRNIMQKVANKTNTFMPTFDSNKNYTIMNDDLMNDIEYSNHVAQMKFHDYHYKSENFQLLFRLLGTETDKAFHLILKERLNFNKFDQFLMNGMKKAKTINSIQLVPYYFKLVYCLINQQLRNIKYKQYLAIQVKQMLQKSLLVINSQKYKELDINLVNIFQKVLKAQKCIYWLGKPFMNFYLTKQNHYTFLFDDNYRKRRIISLKDQQMPLQDISLLGRLSRALQIDLIDICLVNLTDSLNRSQVSENLSESQENLLIKLILWSENMKLASSILVKLSQKVHSTYMLIKVLQFLKVRPNQYYRQLITEEHLEILKSLDSVQIDKQFFGLIPDYFLIEKVTYKPRWPLQQSHKKILKNISNKANILLLSKLMYFFYGMYTPIQQYILTNYFPQNQQEYQMMGLKDKMEK